MRPETDEQPANFLIGPGLGDSGWEIQPPAGAESPQLEGRRLVLRLLIAFVVLVAIAVFCFLVLPRLGLYLPPWVPLAAFAAIAVGVLVNAKAEGQLPASPEEADEPGGCGCGDGRPVGCCPGPRPPQFLKAPPRRR